MNDKWVRVPEILIPTIKGTWRSRYTANADLIEHQGIYFMYYRGTDLEHDRVGVMTCPVKSFDGLTWRDYERNPIIDVGPTGSFDEVNILDPSAVVYDGRVLLYYSGIGVGIEQIGLAYSSDGFSFKKMEQPILCGRCPEVVVRDGIIHLYFVREANDHGYDIYHAYSDDGIKFIEDLDPVLTVGLPGTWDSYSVTTPRIFHDRGTYYMVYAADDKNLDDSWQFGLATSENLLTWEKYRKNPIFKKGEVGSWDESNIWFGTVERIGDRFWMWYEGCNSRRGFDDFISVVGTAYLDAPYFFVEPIENRGKHVFL